MTAERQYEAHARSVPEVDPERERHLSALVRGAEGGERDAAIVELVEGNMRLVLNLTRKYRRMPDYPDILFDGNLGLTKAAATFDAEKGRFSTWATPKIRTEIRDGIYQRTSALSSLRSAMEVLNRAEKSGRTRDAEIVRLAMAGTIPLHDEDGKPIEVADPSMRNAADELGKNDLFDLAMRAISELGLTDDDVALVSNGDDGGEIVGVISRRLGVTKSYVRMMKVRLLWMLRKKILGYVGKDEYLMLSAIGSLPGKTWK